MLVGLLPESIMPKFTDIAARYIISATVKNDGLRLSFDIEADGLLDNATKLHCIVVADLDSDQIDEYGPDQIDTALEHLARADYLAGHNICAYDLSLLRRLHNWTPSPGCTVIDTLITSRLILPGIGDLDAQATDPLPSKLRGRHSLEAWGLRLGIPKIGADITDWSVWTPEMQERCVGDVVIDKAIHRFLQPDGYSRLALELEHQATAVCNRITADGVPFDVAAAKQLHEKWTTRRSALEAQLSQQFPGTNLNSRMQIGALLEARGWKPSKRTEKTGAPSIDDEVLESLPALYPEFAGLAEHDLLRRRQAQLAHGKQALLHHVGSDGRIHGGLIHIGTPHSRAKHLSPNLGQVPNPKKGARYAAEFRGLFRHTGDWVFVACDQSNLQDRGFAHYLAAFDDGVYAQAFLGGVDQHWQVAITLGLVAEGVKRNKENKVHTAIREGAKRFRYAFLFGAGAKRIGEILGDTVRAVRHLDPSYTAPTDGKAALDRFMRATSGLAALRASLKSQHQRNEWVLGLDGRRVPTGADYKSLNRIVTSSEAIICKRWLVRVHDELRARFRYGWDGDVVIVLWVHDEVVVRCRPEIAEEVGGIMVRHAKELGEFYQFRVPLDAEYKAGRSWAGEPLDNAQDNVKPAMAADEVENSEPSATRNGHAGGNGGNAEPLWMAPTLIEVPPGSAEFAAILASLSEEDRAVVRPKEAPRGNGHDRQKSTAAGAEEPIDVDDDNNNSDRDDGYSAGETEGQGKIVAEYIYKDANGRPYLKVAKWEKITSGKRKKSFPQYHLKNGVWIKGKPAGPKIPYRLPELIAAPSDVPVHIFEGEKDAETGAALGLIATTNPEGAGKWTEETQ